MPDIVTVVFIVAMLAVPVLVLARFGRSSRTTLTDPAVLHEIHKTSSGGNLP